MPDTKPDLYFDEEGVCSACKFYDDRQSIDWSQRKLELEKILKNFRDVEGKNWDCIVPVSGGKDSTFQVISLLKLGMNSEGLDQQENSILFRKSERHLRRIFQKTP